MGIGAPKQDAYSKEEFVDKVVPRLEKGRYTLNVAPDKSILISKTRDRWIQREDIGFGE